MMKPPPEVPKCNRLDVLAPAFRRKVVAVLTRMQQLGHSAVVNETLRTQARQHWLYGFGRDYDDEGDPRGIVTNAPSVETTWHGYGLAADIADGAHGWEYVPKSFWRDLEQCAVIEGLVSGSDWKRQDEPHVQWHIDGMHVTPSPHAADLQSQGGNALVWHALQADV